MIFKRIFFRFMCITLILLSTASFKTTKALELNNKQPISTENDRSLDFFDDDGQFEDQFDDNCDMLDLDSPIMLTRQEACPELIIDILKEVGAIETLQQEFFIRTNILNKRSILDQPLFEPHRCSYKGHWVVGAHFFFNKIDRSNLAKNCTRLDSYLALSGQNLISLLQNNIEQIKELFGIDALNLDIALVFGLFQNMTVENRQAGIMFHLERAWEKKRLRILIPLMEQERNFVLTPAEQNAVTREFGAANTKEQEKFQKNFLISDRLGFSDTRIEFDGRIYKDRKFSLRLGILSTIPTAFDLKTGIVGSTFKAQSDLPTFSICKLFDLGQEFEMETNPERKEEIQQKAFDQINEFALGALSRLSFNLLDTKLGNNKHFGIGLYLRNKSRLSAFIPSHWADKITMEGRASLEYLFPNVEKRSYISKNNPQDFANRDFSDESQAASNLAFLEQEFVKKFYLRAFDTRIQPGIIFRWTSKFCYQGKYWGFNFGSDWWVQGKEKQQSVRAPKGTLSELDLKKAELFLAYQSKTTLGIVRKVSSKNGAWYFSLNGSSSTFETGIGNQYAITFNIEKNF